MKINDQRTVQNHGVKGSKKPRAGGAEAQVQDKVEVGQSSGLERSGAVKSARRKNGSQGHDQVRSRQWRDAGSYASIQTAGQAGLAGSIATAQLHYPDGRWNLKALADKFMVDAGMAIDYPPEVMAQTEAIMKEIRPAPGVYNLPEDAKAPWVRDLTAEHALSIDNGHLWTELDPKELEKNPEANVTSRDLDQIQFKPEKLPNGNIRWKIGVSDVDAFIKKDSPIDQFMDVNGSSIYTPDKIYNLIPPALAEDVISLNPRENRFATVAEFEVTPEGKLVNEDVYQAIVHSRAKLDYASVGAWLDGEAPPSPGMLQDGEIIESLQLQEEVRQRLKIAKEARGALDFESNEVNIVTENGDAVGFKKGLKNKATELVELGMTTFNQVMSRKIRSMGLSTLERVVVPPEKWDRIQELASEYGTRLPAQPDGKALAEFLAEQKEANPNGYQDLSFSVIKLIGRGEYMAVGPQDPLPGHFGLGVKNYSQATASIRRGGDRIAARQLKAGLAGEKSPYSATELNSFAENVTQKEQATKKVERAIEKSVIATMLEKRIGEEFDGVVSGVKGDKAWVRISNPPVEGSLGGGGKFKVGQKFRVELKSVNVEKGWIDFVKA